MIKLLQIHIQLCIVSGFRHEVDENCAPLGYYAVCSGNFLASLFGFLTPKYGTYSLSRNIGKKLSLLAAQQPRRAWFIQFCLGAIKEMTVYITDLHEPRNKDSD